LARIHIYDFLQPEPDGKPLPIDSVSEGLHHHHPGISQDGRLIIYMKTDDDQSQNDCRLVVMDRLYEETEMIPCPDGITKDSGGVWQISPDNDELNWHEFEYGNSLSDLPSDEGGIRIPNPFVSNQSLH
jgi:hypothetical protein